MCRIASWVWAPPALMLFLALIAADRSVGAEPPVLSITHPVAGERYSSNSTIGIEARLNPALPAEPEVRLYQVLEDDLLMPQGRIGSRFDGEGRLSLDVGPGADGWLPGTLRIVVIPTSFTKQRQVVDVEIVHDREPVGTSGGVEQSDVLVDLDSDDFPSVPAGQTIAVKGTFDWHQNARDAAPAALIVQIRQPDFDSTGDIIRNEASGACKPLADGKFEYYAEIETPSEAGEYQLRAYLPYVTSLGERKAKPVQHALTVHELK